MKSYPSLLDHTAQQSSRAQKPATMARRLRRHVVAPIMVTILLGVASTAMAKGGDNVPPFPVSAASAGKQEAKAMTVDSSGNTIIAGYSSNGGMDNDYRLVKFNADGSGLAWPAVTYANPAGGDDTATAVAVDGNGDIIVTGYTWNGTNYDIQTRKYAGTDGSLLWQHTFAGAANGNDFATAITVDGSKDIYVAGYSANGAGNDDYLIIKYPSTGATPTWTEIHDDPTYHRDDRIAAIAAGPDGIAVTGYSSKGGADFDLLTRKYGFDQSFKWEQRRSSPGNNDDRGIGVKLDSTGNVIVTGYLANTTHTDILTAKYNAATGAVSWENIYAGMDNDEPRALWVDSSNNVYVAGYTFTLNGHEDFYTVRYNGADGVKAWDAVYHSGSENDDIPVGIVVSDLADGGVFVTGYTITAINDNITTLKYKKESTSDKGVLLWQSTFNGADNKNDRPVGIGLSSLAAASDVRVGGWSDTTANSYDFQALRYDFGPLNAPSGLVAIATTDTTVALTWADNSANEDGFKVERKLGATGTFSQIGTTGPGGISFSDSGLTANSYYYYRVRANNAANGDSAYSNESHVLTKVVSYDAPTWSYQFNGPDNREDKATGIVIGADDHPVVTGHSDLAEEGVAGSYSFDYLTIKLDRADKSVKWKARYDSGDGGTDMAAGVALDSSGNTLVTGTAFLMGGSEKSDDLYTIKHGTAGYADPANNPPMLWDHQYGTQSGIDLATAIKVAHNGSNQGVVIGHGLNGAFNYDTFIIKYNADGSRPWTPVVYDSGRDDIPTDVTFDTAGNVLVTGYSKNADGDTDWFTAKYNGTTGAQTWFKTYAGAGAGDDQPRALALDASGNVIVTGYAVNAAGDEEMVTIKYDGADVSANREVWKTVHNGPAAPNGDDRGVAVAIDPIDGAVTVAGTSYVSTTDSDFHLLRYNAADGAIIWERDFDKPESYDYLTAMTIDSSGYIYLTGVSRGGPDSETAFDNTANIMSLIYDFEGTFLSAMTHDGTGRQDEANAIAVNYQGEAFVAGFTQNASNPDYLVLKQKNPYILVPAPLNLTPPADAGKMNLTWRENSAGTSFRIERTLGPVLPTSTWTLVATPASGTTSLVDAGLATGTNYCYRMYAFTGSLSSRTIEACGTTTLAAPTLNTPTVDSTTQITLSWNQVANNTGYKIERKVGTGAWSDLITKGTNVTTHIDGGLTAGTTYTYRVSTNSAVGYSLTSNEQSAITKPVAPTLNAPTSITNTQMVLGWNAITGAATYTLQYKLTSGSYANFAGCTNISTTSCTVTGLTPNTYNFQVKATNAGGDSAWSNEQTGIAALAVPTWAIAPPATPTNFTSSGMTLSWVNPVVSGAGTISYTLQYRLSSGTYVDESTASACAGTTALTCDVTGLTANKLYYFRIKANNASGSSNWSTEMDGMTMLDTPTLSSAVGGNGQIDLTWTTVAGATAYTIQQADCNKSDASPDSCNGTTDANYNSWFDKAINQIGPTYPVSGLSPGTNYRYRIVATKAGNSSLPSTPKHAWTDLGAPTLTVTAASSTALNLGWDQRPGETNYTIETGPTLTGPWSVLVAAQPMNNVAYTHSSLALNTQYCYQIKAYSGVTATTAPPAAYSAAKCLTTPPDAPNLALSTIDVESSYTVLQDTTKYWTMADYLIGRPVVISSGANIYTKRVAGSVNSALLVSPAFTTETISQGDSYVVLQTVTGEATGNDGNSQNNSLFDAHKNWGMREWDGFKIKILNSVNSVNNGVERTIVVNGGINPYTSANFPVPIVAGDTYQIASFFGNATIAGTTTQLTHGGNTWGGKNWSGYYLLMTSGANNGQARRITSNDAMVLTTDAFPNNHASGDTYLIAPPAKVAPYFGIAAGAGSSTTTLVDTGHVWQANYTGYYLQLTSGANLGKARLITATDSAAKTITVAPAFDNAIASGDSYVLIPSAQFSSYFGVAGAGSSTSQLEETPNAWLKDWSQGYSLMMTSGSNNGQSRPITGKTATTLTVSPAFASAISPGDSYLITTTAAINGSGTVSTTVAPGAAYKGKAKLTLTGTDATFTSTAPGYANNYNYELLSLRDLTPLAGTFDAKFDYTAMSGLITNDGSLPYRYLASSYAALRFDFQSPTGKTYNTYLYRGRTVPQDIGRTTAYASTLATIHDTRTMANGTTAWKNWAVDQWKDYYLQMTSGPNNQLVRKISGNTANSITVDTPFPNDPTALTGTAAAVGNSNTTLVDSTVTTWTTNQWQNYHLHLTSGPNAGQTRKIVSSDASSLTVGGSGFPSPIGSGDSYRVFNASGDSYRINVIAGTAAINGSTQNGSNSTNTVLVDASNTIGSTLPPKNWALNQWAGFHLYLSSGTNNGQFRTIASNTANSITVTAPFPAQINSGDSYTIFDPRPAAQAAEAYWVSIYEPLTTVTEQLIFPTTETAGKLRIANTGSNLQFYTAPTAGAWQLRRQLDLLGSDPFIPSSFWIYQFGRLPHPAGTTVQTKIENFLFTVPAATTATIGPLYWVPEVGHVFRRTSLSGDPLEVAWNAIGSATLYEVERCPSTDPQNPALRTINAGMCSTQTVLPTGDSRITSPLSIIGLTPGSTYRFRVRAKYNATDYTAWGSEQWITITPPTPALVAPTAATTTTSQLTPTWSDPPGDVGFKLYWKVRTGADCSVGAWSTPIDLAPNPTTYNHSGLAAGTYYCYKIIAKAPAGTPDSIDSVIVSQTTKPVAPVLNALSGITTAKIDLAWANVTGNAGYLIERKIGAAGTWNTVTTTAANAIAYSDTGLAAGTLYYYRISATSAGGNSALSNEQSATTTPPAPIVNTTVLSAARIDLAWPVVTGATNYKVERKEGAGSYGEITNQAVAYAQKYCGEDYPTPACPALSAVTITYPNEGLTENTTYCYRVKAWNSTGGDSAPSSEQCATTSAMPNQNLTASALNGFRVKLDWTPIACTPTPCGTPTGFEVEKMVREGNWVNIATVGGTTFTYIDARAIDPARRYRYRVRAVSGTDFSPYSEASVITPPYAQDATTCP